MELATAGPVLQPAKIPKIVKIILENTVNYMFLLPPSSIVVEMRVGIGVNRVVVIVYVVAAVDVHAVAVVVAIAALVHILFFLC